MSTPSSLVQKLWNYCNILRDDGLSYGDYVEQLTRHALIESDQRGLGQSNYYFFLEHPWMHEGQLNESGGSDQGRQNFSAPDWQKTSVPLKEIQGEIDSKENNPPLSGSEEISLWKKLEPAVKTHLRFDDQNLFRVARPRAT